MSIIGIVAAVVAGMLAAIAMVGIPQTQPEPEIWRGLVVEPENYCAPYVRDEYDNPVVSEQDIQEELGAAAGGWYGLYEARIFASGWETHVEHIVAVSEAHDSGLCGRSPEEKQTFGADLNNVTLASPELNFEKGYYDAGEWLPPNARCWFARTVVFVKQTHRLSVDQAERDELERVLSACEAGEVPPRVADDEPEHPPVQTFRNCTLMREAGWTLGVDRDGGTYRTAWHDAEIRTYGMNRGRDRDSDGHACE